MKRGPPFSYSDQEWAAVEACLAKLPPMAPDAAADARSDVECIVNSYLMMAAWSDPRSRDVIARKACWAKVAEHALALNAALEELETLEGLEVFLLHTKFPGILGDSTVIAGILKRRHAEYLVWKSQCAKTASRAVEQVKSFRKSNLGNRARGYYVDGLFASLLGFGNATAGVSARGSGVRRRGLSRPRLPGFLKILLLP